MRAKDPCQFCGGNLVLPKRTVAWCEICGALTVYKNKITHTHDTEEAVESIRTSRCRMALNGDFAKPIPMVLHCPECRTRHVDEGEFATKPHHTHACQSCGFVWRPAVVPTVGVRFLPGFKNET